jgi:hypothetical protein
MAGHVISNQRRNVEGGRGRGTLKSIFNIIMPYYIFKRKMTHFHNYHSP